MSGLSLAISPDSLAVDRSPLLRSLFRESTCIGTCVRLPNSLLAEALLLWLAEDQPQTTEGRQWHWHGLQLETLLGVVEVCARPRCRAIKQLRDPESVCRRDRSNLGLKCYSGVVKTCSDKCAG